MSGADRARRYRDRIARNVHFVTVEVPDSIVQALVRRGLLRDSPKVNAAQIGPALVEYVRMSENDGA